MACYIFGAGDFDGLEERPGAEDYVIAADGGYTACRRAGVEPQLLLGDFDSLAEVPALPHVERVPVEKDDTDMMLAIKRGLERGETLFHLYGGMGGQRTDHTVANLQALLYLADHGAEGWLHGRGERWTAASCFRPVRRVFCRLSAWDRTLRASPSVGRSTRWRGRS